MKQGEIVTSDEISKIFQSWKEKVNKKVRLTERRIINIEEALAKYNEEDILLIIDYIFYSDDDYALFIRGVNERNKSYTELENILRLSKIEDKLARAKIWKSKDELPSDDFGWEIK
jgi:hypothetical protein